MSPLASWILLPLPVLGFVLLGWAVVMGGRWVIWTIADTIRAAFYNRRARRERQALQTKVYARLEATEFKEYRMDDGSILLIRVNLITPSRPKERAT